MNATNMKKILGKILLATFLVYSSLIPLNLNATTIIARDTSAGPTITSAAATTCTLSSYVLSSDNSILVVGVENDDDALSTVTGVTFNGVALTQIGAKGTIFGSATTLTIWEGTAGVIGSGTHNIVATRNGTPVNKMRCIAASYTGADQSIQPDPAGRTDTVGNKTATLTSSVTTTYDNDWTFMYTYSDSGVGMTLGTGCNSVISAGDGSVCDSNAAITPPGSTSMATTCPNAGGPFAPECGQLMIGIKNAAAAPAVTNASFFWVFWW